MPKEYKTIQEVAGPLMMVEQVRAQPLTSWGKLSLQTEKSAVAAYWRWMATKQ